MHLSNMKDYGGCRINVRIFRLNLVHVDLITLHVSAYQNLFISKSVDRIGSSKSKQAKTRL